MTTSRTPARDRALDHLAASLAARDHLADLYSRGGEAPRHVVAELHETVRTGVKLAQVNALLAIEERLAALAPHDVLLDVGLDRVVVKGDSTGHSPRRVS